MNLIAVLMLFGSPLLYALMGVTSVGSMPESAYRYGATLATSGILPAQPNR